MKLHCDKFDIKWEIVTKEDLLVFCDHINTFEFKTKLSSDRLSISKSAGNLTEGSFS